jgi:ABC-type Zn uptake system ZnuABC Zn-binding protein ZnuA
MVFLENCLIVFIAAVFGLLCLLVCALATGGSKNYCTGRLFLVLPVLWNKLQQKMIIVTTHQVIKKINKQVFCFNDKVKIFWHVQLR